MIRIADESVHIQTSPETPCATPSWVGDVALMTTHLRTQGILPTRRERMRVARRRFGRYEVLDVLAVLFGSAIRGERAIEAFDEAVHPCAPVFLALFGRPSFPAALTLRRF